MCPVTLSYTVDSQIPTGLLAISHCNKLWEVKCETPLKILPACRK